MDSFWGQQPGILNNTLLMLHIFQMIYSKEILLDVSQPSLGPYLMMDEVLMGLDCMTQRTSLIIWRYVENL